MSKIRSRIVDAILVRDIDEIERLTSDAATELEGRDPFGRPPLLVATIDGEEQIVRILVNGGACVDGRDLQGWTALHFAAQGHYVGIAKLLLENGADVDARDAHGNSPLFRAVFAACGRGEMIRLLLQAGANRDLENEYGVSPFGLAQSIANYNLRQFFV